MEGTGPRLSRVFSRYGVGPGPSAPVFNGPVRKWKRKWVRSQPNNDSTAGGKGNYLRQQQQHHQKTPSVLLCRWTPLTSSNSDGSSEPSKRKFRYTPVSPLFFHPSNFLFIYNYYLLFIFGVIKFPVGLRQGFEMGIFFLSKLLWIFPSFLFFLFAGVLG